MDVARPRYLTLMMGATGGRILRRSLAALLPAVVLLTALAAGPVKAADDTLRLDVAATYRVDPEAGAVHVILDVDATSLAADTPTQIYFYNTLRFAVQPQARGFKATSGDLDLPVSAEARDGFRAVTVTIPDLYYKQSRNVRLTFDLPSGKPRSDSPIRVGQAHADFVAWAWGDPGLADIRIVVPDRFQADVEAQPVGTRDTITSRAVNGRLVYGAQDISDPAGWYATVDASNPAALTDVALNLSGERVRIHAWPEDDEWLRRVSRVLEYGLPGLEQAIGLPWPVTDDLGVTEVTSAEIAGYAGIYDSTDDEIRISEELDPLVIVHEASHAWFDDQLFKERWIGEGLADEYASRVLGSRPSGTKPAPDPVDPGDAAAFPLNAWPAPSRVDTTTQDSETYGYDASWTVIRAIVRDVTVARMRDVFEAAAQRTVPYVGVDPTERSASQPDWRRFLDLVDQIGGATSADELVAEWVATPAQRRELRARTDARETYATVVTMGGSWLPGPVVREPMTLWHFDDAEEAMAQAEDVLTDRDRLASATESLGLTIPGLLERAYEAAGTIDDLTALEGLVGDWQDAAAALASARNALADERDPLAAIGLVEVDPATGYEDALTAFAAGDDAGVLAGTAATIQALSGAEDVGRGRAIGVGLIALLVIVLFVAFVVVRRRRRLAGPSPSVAAADPYATLAATPDPLDRDEAGASGAEGAEPD